MKRHTLIARTFPIAIILALATAFAPTVQAQPPVVTPPRLAPDYDPFAGITQAEHDTILNYVLRALRGSSTLPGLASTPQQSGALAGTSETFVDVQPDGSYYDPSLGRRVFIVAARST